MSSPSGSSLNKGDLDKKFYIDDASDDDVVDSEAASIVLDSDGSPLLGGTELFVDGVQKYRLPESRKIGVVGAFFLILNKMIGTGIFSTPSSIFASTGSVGICLLMWAAAGLLTLSGLSVYLEFGLAIPRSGGEKNYLERIFRKPRYLATSVFAVQMILLGFSSGNSLAFGRYVLLAAGHPLPDGWPARGIAVLCITFVVTLHAVLPKWGLRLTNTLGVFKVIVLLLIVFSGLAALAGHRLVPDPHNFDEPWAIEKGDGYGGGGAYAYATAMLQVVYSYKGWENANYVMGELKNPRRTLSIAAPLAVVGVTILYVLANVAYFAAIPKGELAKSEVIVAGLFFRNVFGESTAARCLPALVALSNIGNVLAVSFAHSRVNQELAKEGVLPWSQFWASNKPFNTPAASLLLHWLITVIVLIAPPPGAAYNFIVNLYTYPGAWINTAVTCGLIYLQWNEKENWSSPWHTYLPISIVYLLLNLFLAITPFIPPNNSWNADGYPYYAFPLVGTGVLLLGGLYWALWTNVWPRIGGYIVVAERIIDEDTGEEVVRYNKVRVKKLEGESLGEDGDNTVGEVRQPLLRKQGGESGNGGPEEVVYQTFGLDGR
ncbi:Amino acid permease domain containing protein [Rhypophila decipiens]